MRKLCLILLASTLSVSMLIISVVPAMAAKPDPKQPVAWVDSAVNTNQFGIENDPPLKTSHSIHVKLLANGTTVGVVEYHNYITNEKGHYSNFDQTMTKFYEWSDGAKVAEVVALVPRDGLADYHLKYQIVDYGEPATADWHMVFIWLPDWPDAWAIWWNQHYPGTPVPAVPPIWDSTFGPNPIPYKGNLDKPLLSGNANVTIADAYYEQFAY